MKLRRDRDLTSIELATGSVIISYSNHALSHSPSSLPADANAIFVEGPSNFLLRQHRSHKLINQYTYGMLEVDTGPLLKRARTLGIDLVAADPDISEAAIAADTRWLWAGVAATALGSGVTVYGLGRGLSRQTGPMSRRAWFAATGLAALVSAYVGLPTLGIGGRMITSTQGMGHGITATLLRMVDAVHPGSMKHLLRLRNTVVAYKVLWYLEHLTLRQGISRPTVLCLWGTCHSGFEVKIQKARADLLREIAQFTDRWNWVLDTPATLHAMVISRADGGCEQLDVPELRLPGLGQSK